MTQSKLDPAKSNDRKTSCCGCCGPAPKAPDDAELQRLLAELTPTLLGLMDRDDADILARSELQGQTPTQIATQLGCSPAEASRRLDHAQSCFCKLAAATLKPAGPK